jgi:hypothetical protein
MSKCEAKPLKSREIQGLKHVDGPLPLVDQLHEVGWHRDKAGVRTLHNYPYCMLVLPFLFNPVLLS